MTSTTTCTCRFLSQLKTWFHSQQFTHNQYWRYRHQTCITQTTILLFVKTIFCSYPSPHCKILNHSVFLCLLLFPSSLTLGDCLLLSTLITKSNPRRGSQCAAKKVYYMVFRVAGLGGGTGMHHPSPWVPAYFSLTHPICNIGPALYSQLGNTGPN